MHTYQTRTWGAWLSVQLCVFCIVWLTVIVVDPYVTIVTSGRLQAANALPLALLGVALSAATGRPLFTLVLIFFTDALLLHIDGVKAAVLNAHVIYADTRILPMLLTQPTLVLGFVTKSPWLILVAGIAFIMVLAIAWRIVRVRSLAATRVLTPCACIAVLCFAVLPADRLMPTHPDWVVFQQSDETPEYGVLANILYGWRLSSGIIVPGDEHSHDRLTADPRIVAAKAELSQATTTTPDIIIIQSESLFDAATLCGTPDEPTLPALKATQHGDLHVPVFGGRTLQTEFETLTGVPVRKFPNADFAYLDLIRGSLDALPAQFDRLGYRTIAIHPNDRNFWRRSYAFPALGFRSFIDVNAFSDVDVDHLGHVTDEALTYAALSELDADRGPAFIFIVTIENHGPWGGHGSTELEDYVARAKRADAAWRQLIEGLSRRNRPSIALIYGDHLPGLADTFAARCFKDGRPPEDHMPPVAVWSNIADTLPKPPVASYLVPGWVLDAARLPRSELYSLNAAMGRVAERSGYTAIRDLETDYAGVAGQWLQRQTAGDPPQALVPPDAIGENLAHMRTEGEAGPWAPQDLLLSTTTGPGSILRLTLGGKVASMTFRPYGGDPACKTTDPIDVSLDGRHVGTIDGGPGATLATVNTSGASEITLTRRPLTNASTCAMTVVRVVQMESQLAAALSVAHG